MCGAAVFLIGGNCEYQKTTGIGIQPGVAIISVIYRIGTAAASVTSKLVSSYDGACADLLFFPDRKAVVATG